MSLLLKDEVTHVRSFEISEAGRHWVEVARRSWDNLRTYREQRARCKRYLYGEQWGDEVVVNNVRMTEREYIERQGMPAMQNNIMGKILNVVKGIRRQQNLVPICTAVDPEESKYADVFTTLLHQNMKLNRRREVDSRQFEEFGLGGLSVYKVSWAMRNGRENAFVDYVNPNYIFFDQGIDLQLRDLNYVGQLHDMELVDVLVRFAKTPEDETRLKEIYHDVSSGVFSYGGVAATLIDSGVSRMSFQLPRDRTKCRVLEVWSKHRRRCLKCHDTLTADAYMLPLEDLAAIDAENARRLSMAEGLTESAELIAYEVSYETYWVVRYLTPLGHILLEMESPYWDNGESYHPYVLKPYPYLDGEIRSFVSSFIDQQRFVNHYIIMLDFCVKNAAKGVLAIDENSIPEGMSVEDFASEWVKSNGVILYNSNGGAQLPKAIQNASVPAGLDYMINLQKGMMEEVSGVQSALQGKVSTAQTSGYLYQQQVQQSQASIYDLIETYNSFLQEVAIKVLKVITQFYTNAKSIAVSGEKIPWDARKMSTVEYDIAISESSDNAVWRQQSNELLLGLMQAQQISVETMLKAGNFPNSEQILALMEAEKEKAAQQQAQMQQPMQVQGQVANTSQGVASTGML